MHLSSSRFFIVFVTILWLGLISVGLHSLFLFEATPGAKAESRELPAISAGTDSRPQLVMMVHPRCPCSKASLSELKILLENVRDRVNAQVLFVLPEGVAPGWEKGALWDEAIQIPGVTVSVDEGGRKAKAFGSKTSGQVMLFGVDGQLLFHGGITAGRGHVGDNAGRMAVEAILLGGQKEAESTMVFGCPLLNESSGEETECKRP